MLILGAVSDEICGTNIDPGSLVDWRRVTSLILRWVLPLAEILLWMPHLSQPFIHLLFSVSGGGTKGKAKFFFIYDAFPKKIPTCSPLSKKEGKSGIYLWARENGEI